MVTNKGKNFDQDPDAYLSAPRSKDYYQFCYDLFKKHNINSVLDLGCASGDFLHYLPENIMGLGIDQSAELIGKANLTRSKANLNFKLMEIKDIDKFSLEQFDAITCHGTLVTIKNCKDTLLQMIRLRPKLVIINDFFNPFDLDIECGYKRSLKNADNFNYAYNIRSIKTISNMLSSLCVKRFEFIEYDMSTTLKKNDDPLRNYHAMVDDKKVLINGLGLILYGYNLLIFP